ncbi:hypothetical protein AJ80_08300 [Polytolypa hystricis UAMH7299]|uniref:GP-PDE domain-containing protein n=1 Tax=Polytolypa hystricis (strain UAMH7299) TaxID=1447883 RepID=A0A2B7XAE5_POLH7|nr:hypothetical protein AJ80_08300 [Polytolypa hystricis UAMH7299]
MACRELRDQLEDLQWYNKVNGDAIYKIYCKIDKFGGQTFQHFTNQRRRFMNSRGPFSVKCMKAREEVNKAIADLEKACSHSLPVAEEPKSSLIEMPDSKGPNAQRTGDEKVLSSSGASPYNGDLLQLINASKKILDHCHRWSGANIVSSDDHKAKDRDRLIHLLVLIGRADIVETGSEAPSSCFQGVTNDDLSAMVTSIFLTRDGSNKADVFVMPDSLGRVSLHYAAMYGLSPFCEMILKCLRIKDYEPSIAENAILLRDSAGYTPLHYTVINGYSSITKLFLEVLGKQPRDAAVGDLERLLEELLIIAIRYQHDDIVSLLVQIDIRHTTKFGYTPLYSAVQIGRADYVDILLAESATNAIIDGQEPVNGWTPLIIGCIQGHLEIVNRLLEAGANQETKDNSGWTAQEHATFRGHLEVAASLESLGMESHIGGPASSATVSKEVKYSFCPKQHYLIVNLGGMQERKPVVAVALRDCLSDYKNCVPRRVEYSIEVSSPEGTKPLVSLPLPILENTVNEPLVIPVKNISDSQLIFSIHRYASLAEPSAIPVVELVGKGIALPGKQKDFCGDGREPMLREYAVHILDTKHLGCIGTVTFTCLIVKPFRFTDVVAPSITYPRVRDSSVQLVGHRGLGGNSGGRENLQIRENTVESFISAWKHGASFVENAKILSDVQLTRDHVPVIFHDFSLSETGTDVPVYDLTLEQFLYAGEFQSPRYEIDGKLQYKWIHPGKPRSQSFNQDGELGAHEIRKMLKSTVEFKGSKPNARGDFIRGPLATLEELFVKLPEELGFNIEIKYPRLHEAIEAGITPIVTEINIFVDKTLEKIYRLAGNRPIILSSFTPEVCILLSIKQQRYPVLFITNAGKLPIRDMEKRAGSLQIAVRFAKRWNLAGLVVACETFLLCPRLVGYVKGCGMICASYGGPNSVPENVKMQVDAGIDIIITDKVGLIAKILKETPPLNRLN